MSVNKMEWTKLKAYTLIKNVSKKNNVCFFFTFLS